MNKTEQELDTNCSTTRLGSHEYLLNQIVSYVKSSNKKDANTDSRTLRNKMPQLKRLRTEADYSDTVFDYANSNNSLVLSKEIIPILKKY